MRRICRRLNARLAGNHFANKCPGLTNRRWLTDCWLQQQNLLRNRDMQLIIVNNFVTKYCKQVLCTPTNQQYIFQSFTNILR